ncbi:MAG: valine--pyruvate transaminase [Gammaproteobacteria bacterium]|nr:valine--pyruvate transaminase [Gammaproteobacteria bacterium]
MNYSEFGQRFSGYSGITHLMDDLNQGLLQDDMVMLGGGNPAAITEVNQVFQDCLAKLQASGELIKALSNYDGPQGKNSFIDTLAEFFQQQYNWPIGTENIALTHGSQSAFFILFNFFAGKSNNRQQKILIPLVPEYIGYCDVGIEADMIVSQQAKIERLDGGYFKYRIDFDQLEVDQNTGLICVSRPTNPSGNVLTDAECHQLDQIAQKNEVPLLIDSAYGTPFPNIIFNQVMPFWNENTIVCMSLSKLGLPGARTGIVIANEEVIKQFANMTAITSLAPGGIGPVIVSRLIEDNLLIPLCNEMILPFYQKRSQLAVRLLRQAIDDPRVNIHKPEGSLFLWLWFENLPVTTGELYQRLKRRGLLVIPGKYFFPGQSELTRHAESCIRMNYVQSEEQLHRGINILAEELRACWGAG